MKDRTEENYTKIYSIIGLSFGSSRMMIDSFCFLSASARKIGVAESTTFRNGQFALQFKRFIQNIQKLSKSNCGQIENIQKMSDKIEKKAIWAFKKNIVWIHSFSYYNISLNQTFKNEFHFLLHFFFFFKNTTSLSY